MANLYENIASRLKAAGISAGKMCTDLGFSRSTITELKKGRAKSLTGPKLAKIAEYLGTTSDALLNNRIENYSRKHPADFDNSDPKVFEKIFSSLTHEQQHQVVSFMQFLKSHNKETDTQ